VVRARDDLTPVWRALGDEVRRGILDALSDGEKTTTQIVTAMAREYPELSRFAVMKHLDVLRAAGLVLTRSEGVGGRRRINTLNVVPLHRIYARWVTKYQALWAGMVVDVAGEAEGRN